MDEARMMQLLELLERMRAGLYQDDWGNVRSLIKSRDVPSLIKATVWQTEFYDICHKPI